jgi:hypothetical protein
MPTSVVAIDKVQPNHALAGRADLRDGPAHEQYCGGLDSQGGASRRPPEGLPHTSPGAEPYGARCGSIEGCPRAGVWSGNARSTGCPTSPGVRDRVGDTSVDDRLDTLRSQNTSRQPPKTTHDERLQSRNPLVTGAIHEQPLPRSENQRLTVRAVVSSLTQCTAGAHDRQRVERVADQVPHDGVRDGTQTFSPWSDLG